MHQAASSPGLAALVFVAGQTQDRVVRRLVHEFGVERAGFDVVGAQLAGLDRVRVALVAGAYPAVCGYPFVDQCAAQSVVGAVQSAFAATGACGGAGAAP